MMSNVSKAWTPLRFAVRWDRIVAGLGQPLFGVRGSRGGTRFRGFGKPPVSLPDGATVVVVGGGPTGSFFAIRAARKARSQGKKIALVILEKKKEVGFDRAICSGTSREGCNYCAGLISPRLADLLRAEGLDVPSEIVVSQIESLTVHGDWKSIELPVPEGREMFSVFRGSRPPLRVDRHVNFDSYLLQQAVREGAKLISGEVHQLRYSPGDTPILTYRDRVGSRTKTESIEADFVVFASGVNEAPGMDLSSNPLFQALGKAIDGFRPPAVRKALICEMQAKREFVELLKGEVHFAQYGSKSLRIEMSSLMPKADWVTVVLIGPSVDRADRSEALSFVERFLRLPHIRRFLPRSAVFRPSCACNPNMTVAAARKPFGHRVALAGDMVVSRLYKDGLISAYRTASALADCIFDVGIDHASLRRGYWPVVKRLERDNRFGAIVFFLNRVTFHRPLVSRILYQAILTERKTKLKSERRLANILWKTASGDDSYQRILAAMGHPATIWSIGVGGVLVTMRNLLTEGVFGVNWEGVGRYPTGVPKEDVGNKRAEIVKALGTRPFHRTPDLERMYSIKIKSEPKRIMRELGKFGERDRQYLKPRLIKVRRVAGGANEVGSIIRYDVRPRMLSCSVVLEKVIGTRYLLYRVRDGVAEGGVLAFDVERIHEEVCLLSIYVAVDFPRGSGRLKRLFWALFRRSFPGFVHDVLWNHALCKLKHLAEVEEG